MMVSKFAGVGARCHVCASPAFEIAPGYEAFQRVTSDCVPWPSGGRLGVCRACGCVQKVIDQATQAEIGEIYEAYSIYHQSNGAEQSVFEGTSGQASSRSARILERLTTEVQLPETGRMLDVGCGNGALLRTFNDLTPHWSLVGTELNEKYRATVAEIDRVEAFYTCEPGQVPGTFDLITMVHVLEHIPAPGGFLDEARNKLTPGGFLVVQLPDHQQNPFDLVIADHCTHFTVSTASALIQRAGFEVLQVATDWVPKELTVVARNCRTQAPNRCQTSETSPLDSVAGCLQWLKDVANAALEVSALGRFGLFGTSIAATWLFAELTGLVSFFVDEDLNRVGRPLLGCPVYHPQDIPTGSNVFIALPARLAESIRQRIARPDVTYHVPPVFHN